MYYRRQPSIYAGMPVCDLWSQLNALQQASLDLAAGAKVVVASYTQGDGQRQVTYTSAKMETLTATILQLQEILGIRCRARQPIRIGYR